MEPNVMTRHLATLSDEMAGDAIGKLDTRVEHCPDWNVGELVSHIGDVQWFWSEILTNRFTKRSQVDFNLRPSQHSDPIAWFQSQTQRLTEAFDGANDSEQIWTWFAPQQHVGFARRRQLIEVAIHGWDARNAIGNPSPIPVDVAKLGLAEFVEVMAQDLREDAPPPSPIQLVCTDTSWAATMFEQFPGPTAQLTGNASHLLLTLWTRKPPTEPEVTQSLAALDLS
jgi:uncharacterized protein (TIGR03083 family)